MRDNYLYIFPVSAEGVQFGEHPEILLSLNSINYSSIEITSTGHSEAATEKFRFTSEGELGIGGATYGSSGDVLTSGGAGAASTWATPTTGDITGVTAGVGTPALSYLVFPLGGIFFARKKK